MVTSRYIDGFIYRYDDRYLQDSVLDFLPLMDEVNKLEPDVDIILSVRRGRAFANSVSHTPRLSSAEL